MKTGDKLLCIKSIQYTDYNYDNYTYTKNNNYKILYFDDNRINIQCEENKHISFYLKETRPYTETYKDYFMPIKESRKLKLLKINTIKDEIY